MRVDDVDGRMHTARQVAVVRVARPTRHGRRERGTRSETAERQGRASERASEQVSGLVACRTAAYVMLMVRGRHDANAMRCDATTRYGRREISKQADNASEARVRA
jgi:hypothetical protein